MVRPFHDISIYIDAYFFLREFLKICYSALQINSKLITPEQHDYQELLRDNYKELCSSLSDLFKEPLWPHDDTGSFKRNSMALFSVITGASQNSSTAWEAGKLPWLSILIPSNFERKLSIFLDGNSTEEFWDISGTRIIKICYLYYDIHRNNLFERNFINVSLMIDIENVCCLYLYPNFWMRLI